jgi:hypothetical protein
MTTTDDSPARIDLSSDLEVAPAPAPAATVVGVGLWTRLQLAEPVRIRLYGVTAAVIAILAAYGLVDGSTAALWSTLAAAVLGVFTTEQVRASVDSPATVLAKVQTAGGAA